MTINSIRRKIALWLSRLARSLYPQLDGAISASIQTQIIGELMKNKLVLITGAAGNIGSAIAKEMAAQGAMLVLVDINVDGSNAIASKLGGHVAKSIVCDIAKQNEVDELCAQLANTSLLDNKEGLGIDVLIHAAGIQYERSPGEAMDPAQWLETYNTNVIGPAYLTERLIGNARSDCGMQSVLFISSIHQSEVVGWPSYSCSKAALRMLIKELAVELAPSGIRVNGIAPGWVASDEHQQPLRSRYSLLKHQSVLPQSIARAAVSLSSEHCSPHSSGTTLTIDNAMSLFNHRVDMEYKV